MNKHNAHEYLPLVQALADGKTIQFNYQEDGWKDTESVELQYSAKYYRVKPDPRTFEMWLCAEDGGMVTTETYEFCMLNRFSKHYERITVQEVL